MHQPISRKVELYKPRNGEAGTETCRVVKPSSVKTKEPPSPCGFTYGIAVYGPVCTVVWEGRAGNRSPYPDYLIEYLCGLNHRSWGEYKDGKAISGQALAQLLGRFQIEPNQQRMGSHEPSTLISLRKP